MNMKMDFIYGTLFIWRLTTLSCVILSAGCGRVSGAPGGIYASPAVVDAGKVNLAKQTEVSGDFRVVNSTSRIVKIVDTEVSCGCTRLMLSATSIAPQSSIRVQLVADLSDGQVGRRTFKALLITDSKSVPAVALELACHVTAEKRAGSVPINLGTLGPGEAFEQIRSVVSGRAKALRVAAIDAPDEVRRHLTVEPRCIADRMELIIRGRAPEKPGSFTIRVDLLAEGADWEVAQIELQGNVEKDLLLPPVIYMGFVEPGSSSEREVSLKVRPGFQCQARLQQVVLGMAEPLLSVSIGNPGPSDPSLRFALRHPGTAGVFERPLKIILVSKEGKTYELHTEVRARFL